MDLFYTDHFTIPLPDWHRFPMAKYARLRHRAVQEGVIPESWLHEPPAATDDQLTRVHDPAYIARVVQGHLDPQELRELGLPWSPGLVERSRRSVGATLAAARSAIAAGAGVGVNLAGGTHHAFRHTGRGYCVWNDAAVAARILQDEGLALRVLIVDADVHQGDGTAAIFANDPTVFTFSIHGARNYPLRKQQSDLDVELDDGCDDDTYLAALERGLTQALDRAAADLAIYLAGADPFQADRFGRLGLTKAGLARRDRFVFDKLRAARLPIAVAMAGGYAPSIDDIVDIHLQTIQEAVRHDALRAQETRRQPPG